MADKFPKPRAVGSVVIKAVLARRHDNGKVSRLRKALDARARNPIRIVAVHAMEQIERLERSLLITRHRPCITQRIDGRPVCGDNGIDCHRTHERGGKEIDFDERHQGPPSLGRLGKQDANKRQRAAVADRRGHRMRQRNNVPCRLQAAVPRHQCSRKSANGHVAAAFVGFLWKGTWRRRDGRRFDTIGQKNLRIWGLNHENNRYHRRP